VGPVLLPGAAEPAPLFRPHDGGLLGGELEDRRGDGYVERIADDRFALQGHNFTPGTTSTFTFTDHASGTVLASGTLNVCGPLNQPGNYPPPPAGQLSVSPGSCTGDMVLSNAICAEQPWQQIDVSATDDWTFYTTPTIAVFNQPSNGGSCP
jgi:hypothetical protein